MDRTLVSEWQQLSALYDQADAMDGDELALWLAQLHADSHPLLSRLQSMLAAREQAQRSGFMDTLPPLSGASEAKASEWAQFTHVGPYRLLSHLGTGGMSEVWLAERDDGAFQRQVAIKLLFCHAGMDYRDSFTQRFARERDILASLHHRNIASLHDAGVASNGQPWLALEYVEGQTLTRWSDSQQLSLHSRIELFQQVLCAVQHAHANLVIHRDLKPGNILVTGQGEVRLLDFGIAKFMESEGDAMVDSELTRQAGRPLTLQYASPEQIRGRPLTTACDVYSLGVVLYELLSGELPYAFERGSAAQLEYAILHSEPRPPGRRTVEESVVIARRTTRAALGKMLSGDLSTVLLKALAKLPTQRYTSVEAFSADLHRWISGQTVQARAPGRFYRLRKFFGRHPLGMILGTGAVASLAVVAVAAAWFGFQARQESARAVAARDFMLHIFQRANQERARGADVTAHELLETGRNEVVTRLHGQPEMQVDLLRGIAQIQTEMGDFVSADATFSEWVRICSTSLRRPREEALARADQAYNALQMNNAGLAQRRLADARSVVGRPIADPSLDVRFDEVAGQIALSEGAVEVARNIFAHAQGVASAELGEQSLANFRLSQALSTAEGELGNFEVALAMQDRLKSTASEIFGRDSNELSALDWDRVNLLAGAGRFAESSLFLESAVSSCVKVLGERNENCKHLILREAQTLLKLGEFERARHLTRRLENALSDSISPFFEIELNILNFRLQSLSQSVEISNFLRDKLLIFGRSSTENTMPNSFKAMALIAVAESKLRLDSPNNAIPLLDEALLMIDGHSMQGDYLRVSAVAKNLVGVAAMEQGDLRRALEFFEASQAEFGKLHGINNPATLLLRLNKLLPLVLSGRSAEAEAEISHLLPVVRVAFGQSSGLYRQIENYILKLREYMGIATSDLSARDLFFRKNLSNRFQSTHFFS